MAPVKTSPRLSHAALRQFYTSWDGLSHEGKLRLLGNKIGDDKILYLQLFLLLLVSLVL